MTHPVEPCGWTVDLCSECCTGALQQLSPTHTDQLERMATSFLWSATGRRFGLCERKYRPCRRECFSSGFDFPFGFTTPFVPLLSGGLWFNISCGTCLGECQCNTISEVYIPDTFAVTGVMIDGIALDPINDVRVYDHSRILRTDGDLWPICQDLNVADTESGGWSITVLEGLPIPPGGELMAGLLTCELAKACVGDDNCRLPRRIQTITRQGVTVGFQDLFEGLSELRTGLWEVDAWIESNRVGKWFQATITSPDLPDHPTLTWPVP